MKVALSILFIGCELEKSILVGYLEIALLGEIEKFVNKI
jgi:hypothetical protein